MFNLSNRIPDSIAKDIEKSCGFIYPLKDVYIRKVKVVKKPKFDCNIQKIFKNSKRNLNVLTIKWADCWTCTVSLARRALRLRRAPMLVKLSTDPMATSRRFRRLSKSTFLTIEKKRREICSIFFQLKKLK